MKASRSIFPEVPSKGSFSSSLWRFLSRIRLWGFLLEFLLGIPLKIPSEDSSRSAFYGFLQEIRLEISPMVPFWRCQWMLLQGITPGVFFGDSSVSMLSEVSSEDSFRSFLWGFPRSSISEFLHEILREFIQ